MISLEDLVPANHQYRRFINVFDFAKIKHHLKSVEKDANYKGYGVDRLFRCLLLQFMENISDRELERMIQENNSAKWFCGFTLSESTPDFSVFSRVRSRIGTNKLSKIFSLLREQMRRKGFMSEVFTFVDASHLVSKASLWEERAALIKTRYDKINNDNISKVSHDKDA
jgi:transposase